jgi:hypothetical protein
MKLTQQELPTATARTVLRPLGSFEEFFWLYDQHRPLHFALAAQIQGRTTVGRWRGALDLVQRRHPFFSVCIEKNGSNPHFSQETGAPIPLRVVQGKNAVQRWESEIELELSIPFNAEQAPLVRAVLLHEADRAVCILLAHHSIADGRSIAFAIRDLLQALSGGSIHSLPVIPAHEEILGLTRSKESQPAPGQESNTPPGRRATYVRKEDSRPHVRSLRLTPELTAKVRKRARQEGTTVHGALSSAVALAYGQISNQLREEPIRVFSFIDTRKLLGLGEDCALLIGSGVVAIEPRMSRTFWDIARYSIAGLAGAQTMEGIIASRNSMHQIIMNGIDVPTAAAIGARAFAHEVLLTNLGDLPYGTSFGELKLEAVWGPAVSARFEGAPTIGVTTTNGALRLIQTSFGSSDSLLEATKRILVSACAACLRPFASSNARIASDLGLKTKLWSSPSMAMTRVRAFLE